MNKDSCSLSVEMDRDLQRVCFLLKDVLNTQVDDKLGLSNALERKFNHMKENGASVIIDWLMSIVTDLNDIEKKVFKFSDEFQEVPESYGLRHLPTDYVQRQSDEEEVRKLLESGQASVGVIDEKSKLESPRQGTRPRDVVGVRGMGANVWSADAVSFSDVASVQNWIRGRSAEKDSLLVLDDVWDVNHAAAFDILAGFCQLCITSRDSDVVRGLRGSKIYNLGALKKKQARELLLRSAQKRMEDLSEEVRIVVEEILEQCAGLPLALALIGSSLVDARSDNVVDWKDRLEGLQQADLDEIRSCFPKESYPYENLLAAIEARSILSFLERRSLIQNGTREHCYVVHDMLLDYIRGRLIREREDESALLKAHQALLDKYKEKECDLERELLDFSWLKAKLEVTDLASLLADFRYLSSDIQSKEEFKMLKSSLLLSSNIISSCKSQLSGQLLGRWCLTPPGGPLMRTTNGRSRTINAIVVTPDIKRIITGGADGTIRFWDYETGKELEKIEAHSNMVYALALSFRTNLLVSGSFDCTVKVWDMDTLEELVTFTGHKDWISGVAIASSSRKVISSSYDHTIKLWDLKDGLVHTFEGHEGNVRGISLFPNEQLLASASLDKTVKIWNLQTCQLQTTFRGHSDTVYAVAVSPDGRHVVSASEDTVVKIWDIEKATEVRTLIGHTSDIFAVGISHDGGRVYSAGDDKTVKIWSFETGEELATLRGHSESVRVVTVSPDGRAIVSGSEDRTYKLWNLDSLYAVPNFLGHKQGINDLAISPDGRLGITASGDSLVKVWDCEKFEEVASLCGHEGHVLTVALHHQSSHAVSGGRDSTIRIWNLETRTEELCLKKHQHPVQVISFNENGNVFVSGGRDNSIGVWAWANKSCIRWLNAPIFDLAHITVAPRCCLLVGNNQHVVWRYSAGQPTESLDLFQTCENQEAIQIRQDFDSALPRKSELQVEEENGVSHHCTVVRSTVHVGPDSRVQPALLIKGGKRLLLGSTMSCSPLRCLDVVTGMDIGHTIDATATSFVTALATLDGDKEVLVGTDQGRIVRLELDSDTVLQIFQEENPEPHKKSAVTALAKSTDEKRFVTGNSDGELRLWCVNEEAPRLLRSCKSRINGLCTLEKGFYAACDESGHLHLFSVTENSSLSICAHNTPVRAISSFQQTGYACIATGAFECLTLWSARFNDGCEIVCQQMRQMFHPGFDVKAIAFLPEGKSLLTGSCDNVVRLWDTENGQILKTFKAPNFGVNYVCHNEDQIVACFDNSSIVTWCLESGEKTGQIQGHWGKYHVMNILPLGQEVISDGFHYTLKRWKLNSIITTVTSQDEEPLAVYPHSNEVTTSAVSPDGRFLVTGTRDKKLQLWLLKSSECVSEFHLDHSALSIACCTNGRVCVGLSDEYVLEYFVCDS
ncbi:hypothetical protein QZH41_003286 [Actinostola sp. cb2023]|nr:hypothetical protein QZH41_003286 [Actinostola sp. cb2023]